MPAIRYYFIRIADMDGGFVDLRLRLSRSEADTFVETVNHKSNGAARIFRTAKIAP